MVSYKKKFNKLKPLIGVFTFVILSTLVVNLFFNLGLMQTGQAFMALFFLTFGSFKIYNLEGFVKAFKMYDPLAERYSVYAKGYPFIELGLGLMYAAITFFTVPSIEVFVYTLTVLVVGLNAVGVFKALSEGKKIQCACLGDVFNVPMTWVTLFEDMLMVAMAVVMLLLTLI